MGTDFDSFICESKSETLTEIQSPFNDNAFLKKYQFAQSKLDQLTHSLNDFAIASPSSKRLNKSKSACITVSSPLNKSSNVIGQNDLSPIASIAHLKPPSSAKRKRKIKSPRKLSFASTTEHDNDTIDRVRESIGLSTPQSPKYSKITSPKSITSPSVYSDFGSPKSCQSINE